MAVATGNYISYQNHTGSYSGWAWSGRILDNTSKTGTSYLTKIVYLAAPAWEISASVDQTGLSAAACIIDICKWNGGGGFTEVNSYTISMSPGNYNNSTCSAKHNRGGSNATGRYYADSSNVHLWKFIMYYGGSGIGSPSEQVTLSYGGIETIPNNSSYNYMWRPGSYVFRCPLVMTSSGDDSSFIRNYKPSAYYGSPMGVSVARGSYSHN